MRTQMWHSNRGMELLSCVGPLVYKNLHTHLPFLFLFFRFFFSFSLNLLFYTISSFSLYLVYSGKKLDLELNALGCLYCAKHGVRASREESAVDR